MSRISEASYRYVEALKRLKAARVRITNPCCCWRRKTITIDEPGNGRYTVCATCHGQVCDE